VILTLYMKPGCHLCEDLRATLDELRPEYGFSIEEVDIAADAELFARYRYEIPVLLKDGREIARGRVDDRELLRLLRPEA
jgi:glutaredoxin